MKNVKKFIAIILAMIMVMAMLAGCGSKDGQSDSKDSDTGEDNVSTDNGKNDDNDRVLNIQTYGDTGTLHPLSSSGGFVSIMYTFYETLWDYTADGEQIFLLAKSWEKVNDTQYKLTIRDDVTFSNGNPLTASDVWFSMNIYKDDPRFSLGVKVIDFEKTKVTGDYTMDIYYTRYDCTQEISFVQVWIFDEESYDAEAMSMNPIGTGPYVVTDYVVNSHVTCTANENYWGEKPKIDTINFKVIEESSQIINAFEVDAIDMASSVPLEEREYLESIGCDVVTAYGGWANVAFYSFAGALATKEARWAVSYAMDRESMNVAMYGQLSNISTYPSSEHNFDFEDRFSNMHDTYATGYSVEKAKKYAEEADLVGKTLKIVTNGTEMFNDAAVILQENLRAIGVEATITPLDSATYFSVIMDESNFDIALFTPSGPANLAADIMANWVTFVPLGWSDAIREEYGQITTETVSIADEVERGNRLYEALEIFTDVDPWFAINDAVSLRAQSNNLEGVTYMLSGNVYYNNISFK